MSDFFDDFEKIEYQINGVRLPEFIVNQEYKEQVNVKKDIDNFEFLRKLAQNGFKKLNLEKDSEEYKTYAERAKHELQIIKELGFTDYILLVWDVINFCNKNEIPTGYGRGSAAGSLLLFLLGVTKIDPIKNDLYFERFISKTRAKKQVIDGITYLDGSLMCDVDLDICYYNRGRVLEYLEEKFKGKVSKIITFNSLSAKLLVKECGKIVGGKSDDEMTHVSETIPKLHGVVVDIEEAYSGKFDKEGAEVVQASQEFRDWADNNEEIFAIARKLKGLIKNKGVHPSAILLSFNTLDNTVPVELDKDKKIVSSYDMDWASLENVKLDVLGLRGVSVVNDICKQINITMDSIDFQDPIIYQELQDFKYPHGIFQLEADTNFNVSCKVKPKNIHELAAVLALARPGALDYVDKYANYTNFQQYEGIHPFFDEVLKRTAGIAVFQEQAMKMANKIGFDLDEAEQIRRCIGKKKVKEIAEWQEKVDKKIKSQKLDKEIGEVFWKVLKDSAGYSFNASHAYAYAHLSAATIFLKKKYPIQFFLSLLKMTRFEPDSIREISKIHKEMINLGIPLLRPHILKSRLDFSIEGDGIRFGLLSIKGISDKSIEKLEQFRSVYNNKFDLFDAAAAADLNIGVVSALIQAGTFEDNFKQSRTRVVYEAQIWNILTDNEKKLCRQYGEQFNYDLPTIILHIAKTKNEKGKFLIKESRMGTLRKKTAGYKAIYEQNSKSERFANWFYERTLLGYTYNTTLRDVFLPYVHNLQTVADVLNEPENSKVHFIAEMEENGKIRISKNKNKYANLNCADETSSINVKIFKDNLESSMAINEDKIPSKNDIVIVKGKKVDGKTVFAEMYGIQSNKIYTKLSHIKKNG